MTVFVSWLMEGVGNGILATFMYIVNGTFVQTICKDIEANYSWFKNDQMYWFLVQKFKGYGLIIPN